MSQTMVSVQQVVRQSFHSAATIRALSTESFQQQFDTNFSQFSASHQRSYLNVISALVEYVGILNNDANNSMVTQPLSGGSVQSGVPAQVAREALPYLDLSEAAYKRTGAPAGWERLDIDRIGNQKLHHKKSGFDAEVFRNTSTQEVVVAFRGSEVQIPNMPDWIEDLQQAQGVHSAQYRRAIKLAKAAEQVFGNNVAFTGHSLGGSLAMAAGLKTGAQSYAFDAPGLGSGTLDKLARKLDKNQDNIVHIALEGEFASDIDRQQDGDGTGQGRLVGQTYYASADGFQPLGLLDNGLTRHFITPLRESLQASIGIADTTNDNIDVVNWAIDYLQGAS